MRGVPNENEKFFFVLMLTVIGSVGFAADYFWTNGSGDHDFNRGSNWLDTNDGVVFTSADNFTIDLPGSLNYSVIDSNSVGARVKIGNGSGADGELRITGGISTFSSYLLIGADGSAFGKIDMSGGEVNFRDSWGTVGNFGTGEFVMSGGTFNGNRINFANQANSSATLSMTDGTIDLNGDYLYFGTRGSATADISGGSIYCEGPIAAGAFITDANGVVNISGTAVIESAADFSIGRYGEGIFNITGGELIADRISLAEFTANSYGELNISSGLVSVTEWTSLGKEGDGYINLSGGVIDADRITMGQNSTGYGEFVLTGGVADYYSRVEMSRYGSAKLIYEGAAGIFNCGWIDIEANAVIEFVLDGGSGVGRGILARRGNADIAGDIDPYFMTGTETGGTYLVMSAEEGLDDLGSPGVLSSAAVTAGWTSEIVGMDASWQMLLLSYPLSGIDVSWTNNGADQLWSTGGNWDAALTADDRAVIDLAGVNGAVLNSAETVNSAVVGDVSDGSLEVNASAAGQLVNLTVANEAASTGQVIISGGSMDVSSAALIGFKGDADFSMSGGSFTAGNVLAAPDPNAGADIVVSGNAVFNAEGVLSLGQNAVFKMSGWQADIDAESLLAEAGSKIIFEFDGGLAVGIGMFVSGDAILNGTIDIDFVGDNVVGGTYTVLTASNIIDVTEGELLETLDVDLPFIATYEIVEDGENEVLQVTIDTPTTCQEVIDAGGRLAGDINGDCEVNLADLADMALNWLLCNDPAGGPGCDWTIGF